MSSASSNEGAVTTREAIGVRPAAFALFPSLPEWLPQ